jgi:hypothetical protein
VPSYDARVVSADRIVQLDYFGLVRQATGKVEGRRADPLDGTALARRCGAGDERLESRYLQPHPLARTPERNRRDEAAR